MTNVTSGGGDVTITSQPALTTVKASQKLDFNFTFTYARTGSRTLTVLKQPTINDFLGVAVERLTHGTVASNAGTTLNMPDTSGIQVGMFVEDVSFQNGESTNVLFKNARTVVTALQANDNVTLSNAHSGVPAATNLRFFSDWQYELVNVNVATDNDLTTLVTVTGSVRVLQYGTNNPPGEITLQPSNFITTT